MCFQISINLDDANQIKLYADSMIWHYEQTYPEYYNYEFKARGDIVEIMMAYIYEYGGEGEVVRIFNPLWTALVRLEAGSFRRKPPLLKKKKQKRVRH